MLRIALLILGWGFATAACLADQDEIDPAKTAAIRELLEITGAQANRTALTRTFTQQLVSVLPPARAGFLGQVWPIRKGLLRSRLVL